MSLDLINVAYCQVAAETFLDKVKGIAADTLGVAYDLENLSSQLIFGNEINTKLTPSQAEAFASTYQVLYTHPNDATGLAFSVFGAKDSTGALTGELVLSIRSTEFDPKVVDGVLFRDAADIAADKQLTTKGYAYYQLAALTEQWDSIRPALYSSLTLAGVPVGALNVTGYSLSGNIAAGFVALEIDAGRPVGSLTLFNGAGIGDVPTPALKSIISDLRNVLTPELLATGIQSDSLYLNTERTAAVTAVMDAHSADFSGALWSTYLANAVGASTITVPFGTPDGQCVNLPVTNVTGWDGANMVAALGLRLGTAAPFAIDDLGIATQDATKIADYMAAELAQGSAVKALYNALMDTAGPGHSIVELLKGIELQHTLEAITANVTTLQQSNALVQAMPNPASRVTELIHELAQVLAPSAASAGAQFDYHAALVQVEAAALQSGLVSATTVNQLRLDSLEALAETSLAHRYALTHPSSSIILATLNEDSLLYSGLVSGSEQQWASTQYRQDRTLAFSAEYALSGRAPAYYASHFSGQTLAVEDKALNLVNQFSPGTDETAPTTARRVVFAADYSPESSAQAQAEGDSSADRLYGGRGSTLIGYAGADLLFSGGQHNHLIGGSGYDTYQAMLGDTVTDEDGKGELHLLDASESSLSFSLTGTDLDLTAGADSLTVTDWFAHPGQPQMSGGLWLGGAHLSAQEVSDKALTFRASNAAPEVLTGMAGFHNTFYGDSGADTMEGQNSVTGINPGNEYHCSEGGDTCIGTLGNDEYFYAQGDGNATIRVGGGIDVLHFQLSAEGVSSTQDIQVLRRDNDLILNMAQVNTVTIKDWYAADANKLSSIEFSNGTRWTITDTEARAITLIEGTSGDDQLMVPWMEAQPAYAIWGRAGDDYLEGGSAPSVTFDGGPGNDIISLGWQGASTLYLGPNDGDDRVYMPGAGSVTIAFKAGVTPQNLQVNVGEWGSLQLSTGSASAVLYGWFDPWNSAELSVRFEGGEVLSKDTVTSMLVNHATAGSDWLRGTQWATVVSGGAGNDFIFGGPGVEQLSGDAGDDTIYVGTGANVINGGPGLDTIHGETGGSKTYLFGAASELDTLSNWNATPNKVDILLIDAELAPTDITLALEETPWGGSNLIVQSTSTGARFTVTDYGSPWATSANRIDQIKFADGTIWHEDEIRQLCAANPKDPAILIGTPWTDSLYGGTITSQIKGLAGNDALNASSTTNALVVGGPGDDTLYGGAYTHFLFEAGDGQDTVYAQNNNQLEWGTSLIGHTVTATKQGSDLVVKTDTGDSVTVVGWAQAQAPSLKTPYGQVWSAPVVNSKFRPDYTGTHYGDGYYAVKDINAAIQAKLPTDALRRQYEGYIRMGTDAASTSQTMVSHGYYNANGAVSEYGTWLGTSSHWIGAWSDLNPSPSVVTPGQNSLYDYAIVKYTAFLGPDRQIDVAINSVIARTMTLDEGQRLGYNLPLGLDPLYTNPESQVVLAKGIDSFKLFG